MLGRMRKKLETICELEGTLERRDSFMNKKAMLLHAYTFLTCTGEEESRSTLYIKPCTRKNRSSLPSQLIKGR